MQIVICICLVEIVSSDDDLSSESCGTDCDCKNSSQSTIHTEYDVVTSSSHHFMDSNSSDSSSIFDDEVNTINNFILLCINHFHVYIVYNLIG